MQDFFLQLFNGDMSSGFGEEYNIFACEQGILIAETLQTKEEIVKFHKADWEDQKKMVPGLSTSHSGGTFGMSCQLAISYLPMIRDEKIDTIIK